MIKIIYFNYNFMGYRFLITCNNVNENAKLLKIDENKIGEKKAALRKVWKTVDWRSIIMMMKRKIEPATNIESQCHAKEKRLRRLFKSNCNWISVSSLTKLVVCCIWRLEFITSNYIWVSNISKLCAILSTLTLNLRKCLNEVHDLSEHKATISPTLL